MGKKGKTRQQRWQDKMKESQRCVTCGGPLADGSILRCPRHLKERRLYQKQYWKATRKAV